MIWILDFDLFSHIEKYIICQHGWHTATKPQTTFHLAVGSVAPARAVSSGAITLAG
jgi:hypothetical protein